MKKWRENTSDEQKKQAYEKLVDSLNIDYVIQRNAGFDDGEKFMRWDKQQLLSWIHEIFFNQRGVGVRMFDLRYIMFFTYNFVWGYEQKIDVVNTYAWDKIVLPVLNYLIELVKKNK